MEHVNSVSADFQSFRKLTTTFVLHHQNHVSGVTGLMNQVSRLLRMIQDISTLLEELTKEGKEAYDERSKLT